MHDTAQEIWRTVPGYPGLYQVSDHGRVRSLPRRVLRNGQRLRVPGRVMRQGVDDNGRCSVSLWREGKGRSFRVHRLVMSAFWPNFDPLLVVNHIDGNPSNNHLSNLEWTSQRGNAIHARDVLRRSYGAKVSAPVIAIPEGDDSTSFWFRSAMEAKRYGFSANPANIYACLNGKRRVAGGCQWQRA